MKQLILILIFSQAIFAKNKFFTLSQALQQAEKNAPLLLAEKAQLQSLQQEIDSLPKWYLPEIKLEGGYTAAINTDEFEHGPLARLVTEFTIWDGGRTHYANRYKTAEIKAQQTAQKVSLISVKSRISEIYFNLLLFNANVNFESEKIKEFKSFLRSVRQRVRIGRVGRSDVKQVELEIEKQKADLINLQSKKELSLLKFKTLLRIADSEQLNLPQLNKPKKLRTKPDFTPESFNTLPWVVLRQKRIKALTAHVESKNRELYWPKLSTQVYGGYGPHIDTIDPQKPEAGFGVKVEVPLFSNRNRKAILESIRLKIEAEKQRLKHELLEAKVEYRSLIANYKLGLTQSDSFDTILAEQKKNLALSYREFARGVKSFSDMQNAIREYYHTLNQQNLVLYRLNVAHTRLQLLFSYSPSKKLQEKKND